MGAQALRSVIQGDAGFVAGGFDAEYKHGVQVGIKGCGVRGWAGRGGRFGAL
jgi:hypothetical protein